MHGDAAASASEALRYTWGAGVAGGIIGGVGMGGILHAGANMMPFIGALYGSPTVLVGWAAHLANSVLIGLLFTLIVSRPVVREQTTSIPNCVVAGIVYAAAVGLVTSGIMLPIAMNALGTQTLPEPLFPLPGVLGEMLVVLSVAVAHVVYGFLLGLTYGAVHTRPRSATTPTHRS